MFKFYFFLFSILVINFASQSIPLPKTLDGLSVGKSSTFHLEAHYDLLCPDSRETFKTLTKLFHNFNLSKNDNFRFTIHFFPLPYHTFAHKAAIGERFIQDNYGIGKAWEYVDFLFSNQETFSNGNLSNSTFNDFQNKLGRLVSENLNISSAAFVSSLNDPKYDQEARISWKFGCSRAVSGTPTFFVNGIKVDDAPEFQYADWVRFLQDFVNLNQTESFLEKKLSKE